MGKLKLATGLFLNLAATSSFAAITDNFTNNADYVIVGGGPAGLVLAERLSRGGNNHVVLLEAGPEDFNSTLLNSKHV